MKSITDLPQECRRLRSIRTHQYYADARCGAAEVVIQRGEWQSFANRQFQVGGVVSAQVGVRANGRIC